MTDIATTTDIAGTVSTNLTPGTYDPTASGGGTPAFTADKPDAGKDKPESLQDVLADEMRKSRAPDAEDKGDDKEKPEPAPGKEAPKADAKLAEKARTEDAKPEPVKDGDVRKPPQQEGGQETDTASSEDDKSAPPARITDDAKKYWRSTPRAIKAEFGRLEGEISRITQEAGEATRFYSELRDYDGMAKQAGISVKAALDRYVAFDRQIAADIGKGFAAIAKEQGKTPQEAIGSVLRAYGVTPQQFAQMATQNPQAFTPAPQPQRDPALQQVLAQQQQIMQRFQQQDQSAKVGQLEAMVQQWAADKADYQSLEGAIAEILQSGIIERIHGKGLSEVQRLDAAYRMAGGNASAPDPRQNAPAPVSEPVSTPRDDAGKKSVRGAPSDGLTPDTVDTDTDLKSILRKELRKIGG